MKRFLDGKMRLLSLLLSLVLVVGLMQTVCLPANAVSHSHLPITTKLIDSSFYEDSKCLKSMTLSIQCTSGGYLTAYGKIAVHNAEPQHDCYNHYSENGVWPTAVNDPTFIAFGAGAEFEWTDCKVHTITVTFADNVVQSGNYPIYLWTRSGRGVYADALLTSVNSDGRGNATLGNNPGSTNPQPHTHTWPAVPATGNGSKEASATITCTDPNCGETVTVTLKASDVTLPGDVFTAQISTTPGTSNYALRAVPTLPEGLTISSEPGYKYSVSGSDFTTIDPNNFTPKQGIYQASIVVMSGNAEVANLAVKYTVSDPVVTAATGDNRPIEMMVMGLVVFSAMAAVAFIFDSKRRVGR